MKISKINISDIESISEKISFGVSKKVSMGIFFGIFSMLFILAFSLFGFENFSGLSGVSASIIDAGSGDVLHGSSVSNSNINYLNVFYLFLLILFFTIYTLYVYAKMELQKFGEYNGGQKEFVVKNFPSIYILETMTMLYVISFAILSFYLISKIDFTTAFKTINSSLQSVANFSLFGGSLSSLFYFLHKVRPGKLKEGENDTPDKRVDFDINRVLKYLSFPFMSAGMGVVSYLIIMGSGDILGIEFLQKPSEYFIILLSVMAGYFCDAFVIFFHSIFKSIEKSLNKKISK